MRLLRGLGIESPPRRLFGCFPCLFRVMAVQTDYLAYLPSSVNKKHRSAVAWLCGAGHQGTGFEPQQPCFFFLFLFLHSFLFPAYSFPVFLTPTLVSHQFCSLLFFFIFTNSYAVVIAPVPARIVV